MLEKFIVSRDDSIYEAFPDVTLTQSGRLVCTFAECTHHGKRSYTRFMLADSTDRGRTWSPKRPLSDPMHWSSDDATHEPFWNCPRISTLADGRLVAAGDLVAGRNEGNMGGRQENYIWISEDEGATWEGPTQTPVTGIVPDQLVELKTGPKKGRWLLSAHCILGTLEAPVWRQRTWLSDDQGKTWSDPVVIAAQPGLKLCEGSVAEMPDGELVCFMRENSAKGLDCYTAISRDQGETWSGVYQIPIPACHRPVGGVLQSGRVLVTHRYMQGGKGWIGSWTQNFFAALMTPESALATERTESAVRIMPIDYDRSTVTDLGYSGWVQFDDGEIYIVNYIVDDAPNAHIRGYSLRESDMVWDNWPEPPAQA